MLRSRGIANFGWYHDARDLRAARPNRDEGVFVCPPGGAEGVLNREGAKDAKRSAKRSALLDRDLGFHAESLPPFVLHVAEAGGMLEFVKRYG